MQSRFDSPEDTLPRLCDSCEKNTREIGSRCVTCEMQWAIDNSNDIHAYNVAEDFGRPASAVRIMIRARNEKKTRIAVREMMRAVRCMGCEETCSSCLPRLTGLFVPGSMPGYRRAP